VVQLSEGSRPKGLVEESANSMLTSRHSSIKHLDKMLLQALVDRLIASAVLVRINSKIKRAGVLVNHKTHQVKEGSLVKAVQLPPLDKLVHSILVSMARTK
jgi:hypothetical protein